MNKMNFNTALIHAGIPNDESTGAVNIPIYQSSTFRRQELYVSQQWEYSRSGNPTRAALESLIADLEGGSHGLAFASGLSALTAVLSLLKQGDKVLLLGSTYGGTFRLVDRYFQPLGIGYRVSYAQDLDELEADFEPDIKALIIESPSNPLLEVTPLRPLAALCHKHGALAIADNTFMTPYLQRPLELGFDIVVHSATKYLGGHSDLLAGLAVVKDEELARRLYFIQNATGAVLSPFDSFLLIRGIRTLGLRMDRHCQNALYLATKLADHKLITRVHYPGLPADPEFAQQREQASQGGGMVSLELDFRVDLRRFFKALKLIALAESLGGVESLICHPESMTHASMPASLRERIGIGSRLIRVSVGIEDKDDLLADLTDALEQASD